MKIIRTPLAILFAALILSLTSGLSIADEAQETANEVAMVSVNVNSASAEELAEKLDGVGPARAELIIKYREENGPFSELEQLLEVKGIGTATLEKNRARILL